MKAVVAAFNQEKALVGAFSVITNLQMELFEALVTSQHPGPGSLVMTVGRLPGDPGARVLRPLPRPGAGGRDVQHQRGGPVRRPHDLRPGQSSVATVISMSSVSITYAKLHLLFEGRNLSQYSGGRVSSCRLCLAASRCWRPWLYAAGL